MSSLVGAFVFAIAYGGVALAILYLLKAGLKNDTFDTDNEKIWEEFSLTKEDMKV